MHRTLFSIAFFASLLLTFGCGAPASTDLQIGEPLPAIELPDLDGRMIELDSFRGRPMILNFWATWCRPCVHEMPALQAIARATDVAVVGISLDDGDPETVRAFVARQGLDYTILFGDRELFFDLGGNAIPYTVLLDASHTVIRTYRGVVSERTLERDLQRLTS